MKKIGYEGIGQVTATMEAGEEVQAGMAVSMAGNGLAAVCPDRTAFCGIVRHVRDGQAAVQVGGFVRAGYSGAGAPAVGWNRLAGDGTGRVAVNADKGREVLVTEVDESGKTIVMYL